MKEASHQETSTETRSQRSQVLETDGVCREGDWQSVFNENGVSVWKMERGPEREGVAAARQRGCA